MIKKWLSRLLVLLMIGTGTFFAWISTRTQTVPIEKSSPAKPNGTQGLHGKDVVHKAYDSEGRLIQSGTSREVTLVGEKNLELQGGLELHFERNNRRYTIKADSYSNLENGGQILRADSNDKVLIREDGGLEIETPGPITVDAEGVYRTESSAEFRMGNSSGECVGLAYKPFAYVTLEREALFHIDRDSEVHLSLAANRLHLDTAQARGTLDQGRLTSYSTGGQSSTLSSETIEFLFNGGTRNVPFRLERAEVRGNPARFSWNHGVLTSPRLDAQFDAGGKQVRDIRTGAQAHFTAKTEDDYLLEADTGALHLTVIDSMPGKLQSQAAIKVQARKENAPNLILRGESGIETLFENGVAVSTFIHGKPHFRYGNQTGKAGDLRVSHREHNIIFSQGSELIDADEEVRIYGDEILLTNWDQEDKEIFAFRFVEIVHRTDDPEPTRSWGDELRLALPGHHFKLRGAPAKLQHAQHTITAAEIDIRQIDEDLYEVRTDDRVSLNMQTEQGLFQLDAKTMNFSQATSVLHFQNVEKAVMPPHGELSCDFLEVGLVEEGEKRFVDYLKARQDVIFKGSYQQDETAQPVSGRADELIYSRVDQTIQFLGNNRDVVFNHPSGEFKGPELTYYPNDGTMRAGSGMTTINSNSLDNSLLKDN
ncbi:OstA-like-N domain-containing protein [Sulfidibacter corallicola]|uniref:Uncharacterized protein n=1 Tax=Sulfidibacter corallicola TaxID=2818388 RepID=A0A8A4TUB7_SULCO|nr:hypothetical protein [Sulfidibacter corallicola]QTD52701.1 hypothetical protein J3U87_09515 [Sulfidibacter corallicola]